jgi:hypothetical protein
VRLRVRTLVTFVHRQWEWRRTVECSFAYAKTLGSYIMANIDKGGVSSQNDDEVVVLKDAATNSPKLVD